MRIVINAYSARIGGGRAYVLNLLARLPDRADLEIHLFAHDELTVPEDPRIRRVRTAWPVTNPLSRRCWERVLLPRYLRAVKADLLFCPGGVLSTPAPSGCKTATMFRNMLPFDPVAVKALGWSLQRVRNRILRREMLRSLTSADLSIFIADHGRSVIEQFGTVPNPITIPHGITPAFRNFDRPTTRPVEAGDGPYVLYVSRFEPYKHHLEVVQAFASLSDAARGNRRLLLAGEFDPASTDPTSANRVRAWIDAHGIGDRVLMLGGVPYAHLPALNAHADLILFASSCENCPNILLESLAAGRPLAASNIMPMPEFGGPDIAYFTPSDPADIARAMTDILTDPARAAAVAQASADRSKRYDWDVTAARTWQALADNRRWKEGGMKILVLGATGMLGNALLREFAASSGIDAWGTVRSGRAARLLPSDVQDRLVHGIDVTDIDQVTTALRTVRPDVVVNCIGLVKQLASADDPLEAIPINALVPHRLARLCDLARARFIHMSTDCIFSGKAGMYVEGDPSDAKDLYGRSKYLGEVDYPNAITLRTSIIGHELDGARSLINWFLSQEGTTRGFGKAIFSGLPTVEIARVIRDHVLPNPDLHGVWHVSADPIDKLSLLRLVADAYSKTIDIVPDDGLVIDRSLDSTRFRRATGFSPKPWPALVASMAEFR